MWSLFLPHLSAHRYTPRESVFAADTSATDIYWITEGEVELSRETPFGSQRLATLQEGQCFGEMGFLDGRAMNLDVHARTATVLWQIEGSALWKLTAHHPALATHCYRHFWPSLAHKLNQTNRLLKQFFGGSSTPTPPPLPAFTEAGPPARPAWFRPPETPPPPSISLDALPQPVEREAKHRALHSIGLSPEEIDLLLERGEEIAIAAEDPIFKEGDFGDTLYFILHGQVRIHKEIPGAGDEALAILEAGAIFGEMALVAPHAVRSASSAAHEGDALLLAIRHDVLQSLKGHDHELPFLQALGKMMAFRLRESYDRLVSWKMMRGGFF